MALFQELFDRSNRELDGDNGWRAYSSAFALGAGLWAIVSNAAEVITNGAYLIRALGRQKLPVTLSYNILQRGTGGAYGHTFYLGITNPLAAFANSSIRLEVSQSDSGGSNTSFKIYDGAVTVASKLPSFDYAGTIAVTLQINEDGSGSMGVSCVNGSDSVSWGLRTWTNGVGDYFGFDGQRGTDGVPQTYIIAVDAINYAYIQGPTVTTQAVSGIQYDRAMLNGTVVDDNGSTVTERGFVYATTPTPVLTDSSVQATGTTGQYSKQITGLNSNTLYYVRAYAKNSDGTEYGPEVSFTTSTAPARTVYKDMGGIDGQAYGVRLTVGGTLGTLTVRLGSTGTATVLSAGAGVSTISGTYGGLNGLTFEASADFNGTVDDVMYVLLPAGASVGSVDWSLTTFTSLIAIASSVVFRRLEDTQFNRFRIFRYLDMLFKDLDGYATVTIREEHNDIVTTKTKTFVLGGTSGDVSPFIKKKVSFLSKNQAILIGVSNANLNDAITIAKFQLSGIEVPSKLFDGANIISVE